MDNNQQKRVVVFIRRPVGVSSVGVHPCQAQWHGCLFRVFGKRAHPLMCKASAARWPPWPAAGGGRTPCAQCAGAAPARSGPLTGTTGKWRSDRHKDRNIMRPHYSHDGGWGLFKNDVITLKGFCLKSKVTHIKAGVDMWDVICEGPIRLRLGAAYSLWHVSLQALVDEIGKEGLVTALGLFTFIQCIVSPIGFWVSS